MNKKDSLIYLVEGECEEALIKAIKNEYILSGKIRVLNMLQKNIGSHIRVLNQKNICIIIDIDVLDKEKLKRLNTNIEILIKNRKRVILICQNKKLEDELITSTKLKNETDLYELFGAEGENEFKGKFIAENSEVLLKKLEKKGFDIGKIWGCEKPEGINLEKDSKAIKIKR